MWYYITYPIRWFLRHKVERYRKEVEQIKERQKHYQFKTRRIGMTNTVLEFMWYDVTMLPVFERFIRRWSL